MPVRPDGRISVPLLQDVQAEGRTPKQLGSMIATNLKEFVQEPEVTVIVQASAGRSERSIRIIGEAIAPKIIPYYVGITLIDAMTDAGGLTDFADGDRAFLVRAVDGKRKKFHLRVGSLIKGGNLAANIELAPGDAIVIPQRWY